MKWLSSRPVAAVVLAVVVVLSTLFGSHRSLMAERREVEGFQTAVLEDVNDCRAIGANLLTVAGRYLSQGELAGLTRALETEGLEGWEELMAACGDVLTLLEGEELTPADADYAQGFRADLAAEADTLGRDPYNEYAREFNDDILGDFPAGLLGALTGVDPLDTF